jgi:hypothetical protein
VKGSESTIDLHPIILANESRLVRELLRHVIEKAPNLLVAAETDDADELPSMVDQIDAEWVIVSLSAQGRMPNVVEPLLRQHPSLRILGVAVDSGWTRVKWIEAREEVLDNLSEDGLIAVLETDGLPESWHDLKGLIDSIKGITVRELGPA